MQRGDPTPTPAKHPRMLRCQCKLGWLCGDDSLVPPCSCAIPMSWEARELAQEKVSATAPAALLPKPPSAGSAEPAQRGGADNDDNDAEAPRSEEAAPPAPAPAGSSEGGGATRKASHNGMTALPYVKWAEEWSCAGCTDCGCFGSIRTICVCAWMIFLIVPTLFFTLVRARHTHVTAARLSAGSCRRNPTPPSLSPRSQPTHTHNPCPCFRRACRLCNRASIST